ncbi:MAG: hypothetical protein ACYCV7_07510 [Acidimicrobiales bacterium]
MSTDWNALATTVTEALHLEVPPVAMTFADERRDGIPDFDAPMSQPMV